MLRPGYTPSRLSRAGLLALVVGGATTVLADSPPGPRVPTFQAGVGVVNLDVSVTDPRDRHVTDLLEGDLTVFEDGVPQQICLFTRERLPISLSILIDSSGSMKPRLAVAQSAALRFVRTLRPGDEAEVVQFNRHYSVLQPPTSDASLLEAAIGRIQAEGETALHNALYIALKDLAGRRRQGELRRRAVVVLSDGEDTSSLMDDEQVLGFARRSDVAVYAIGLLARLPGSSSDTGVPTYFLTAIARETGGRAYFPTLLGELDGVYDRVADELRTLYGVGYIPSNGRQDGLWRRIAVQTTRPNLVVRHRPGYFAARLR